jgi:hypothetical protein
MNDAGRRKALVRQINNQLVSNQTETAASASAHNQERDRLFGAMLLTGSVVQQTRQSFMAGDFRGSLAAARELLDERLGKIFPASLDWKKNMCEWLTQDPPPLLLPNVSGNSLRLELEGLSHLLTGSSILLDSLVRGPERIPEDPAPVLKYLVLVSLLVEKLDSAESNPLFRQPKPGPVKKSAAKPKKAAKSMVKKPVKKSAKRVALKTTKKTVKKSAMRKTGK